MGQTIMGIDEVGRGCWAGPLVAGAVVLPDNYNHGVNTTWRLGDSKKLSKRQRERAAQEIPKVAVAYGLGWVSSEEVDAIGLTAAVRLAMERAVESCTITADKIIIDGSLNFLAHMPNTQALVQADDIVPAVSAASIMAKVARDNWMIEAARTYPGYGFEHHVGYGTAQHRDAINTLGICRLHRRSFKPIAAYLVP